MKPSVKQLAELATPFASVADELTVIGQDFPWLNNLRQQALEQFNSQGLPSKKVEDWKYTSLWDFAQQTFIHDAAANAVTASQSAQLALLEDAYRLVIVDGVYSSELSQLKDMQVGLTLSSLSTGVEQVQQQLGQQVDVAKAGLTALNTMLMNDGVVITVSANTEIAKPIELLVINSGQTENLAVHLRNVIVMEKNSKATFIEHYVSLNAQVSMTNVVTEVVLEESAELHHYKLQQESENAFHIATLAAKQAAKSKWHTNNISLGAKLARNDIHSQLEGEHSHTTMDGLYLVNNNQHVDNHTRIDHLVPNTTSDELYKGVLDGNSHAVFNGKVMVHKDAQKTNSNQKNQNLLLSRGCEIDTKPEMEIYADDVICGHGSTVGQIDQDQLFYLRARGLDEVSARSLLTFAFAVDVLERIPSTDIRQALSNVIEQRLPRGGVAA
ncbi:MAG: Fe-S cluster assembly protein SufD [Proteobacteria bacterium]|nr:Fe-S cluster assembly protein SufD [Pseudomonadota bacterium]